MNVVKKLRIGVIGLIHDHIWNNLEHLKKSSLGELIAASDPNPELLQKIRSDFDCQLLFDSHKTMLNQIALDAVYVYTDNASSVSVVQDLADRGIHALVEKPMAASLAGANRMLQAAVNKGIYLMINWPFAWRPGLIKALEIAKQGEIGDLFSVKYRAAHAGPKEYGCTPYFYNWLYDEKKNGAGALIDYCSYGAVLARYLLGQPIRVFSFAGRLQKQDILVDDNAVIVMEWHDAVAISEASWTQIGDMTSYETAIYGTKGTLFVERGENGRLWKATRQIPNGVEIDAPPLPDNQSNATEYFLSHILKGGLIKGICDPKISRDAQEILEAGLWSSRSGKRISLPLPILTSPY